MNMKICTVIIAALCISCIACEKIPTDSEVISMIDKLDEEKSLPLFGGLTLEKVESANDNSPRSSEDLTSRIIRYLKSHSINYDLSEARSSVGGKIKPVIIKKVKSTFLNINFSKQKTHHRNKIINQVMNRT